MPRDRRDERTEVRSPVISWLKIVFFSLTAGSLLQIAFHANSVMPGSTPVFYVVDGSNNIRQLDPDSPFPKADGNPQTQTQTQTQIGSNKNSNKNSNEHRNNEIPQAEPETLPPIPKVDIGPFYTQAQKRIDETEDAQKCFQFGVPVLPKKDRYQKRIFFGAMLADENPEVLEANAVEVYNQYHVIALVESNTTHSGEARGMNFGPGSRNARLLQESEMFGYHTNVVIDYWLEDMEQLYEMDREVEQRNTIWKIWLDQGMAENDIGIMADLDEIVSREFLNALQVCDFPKLRYDPKVRPTCQTPKMALSSIQFEASPLCIKRDEWHHPDIILGSCVAGVGDPTGRTIPLRGVRPSGRSHQTLGSRTEEWGFYDHKNYPKDVIENNRFPLWDGRDIREVNGNADNLINFAKVKRRRRPKTKEQKEQPNPVYGAAYHLHNWFQDTETLRHKYATYGHPDIRAKQMPLSGIRGDLNMMVRCVRDLGNDIRVDHDNTNWTTKEEQEDDRGYAFQYYMGNQLNNDSDDNNSTDIFTLGGNRPIYFQNKEYVRERHALVQEMIRVDEEKHGTLYPEDAIRREQERKKALQENEETSQEDVSEEETPQEDESEEETSQKDVSEEETSQEESEKETSQQQSDEETSKEGEEKTSQQESRVTPQ